MPVPLMQSSTPSRGSPTVAEVTCRKVFTRDCGSAFGWSVTPYTTPLVPPVAAISPGFRTSSENALFGWSPAR